MRLGAGSGSSCLPALTACRSEGDARADGVVVGRGGRVIEFLLPSRAESPGRCRLGQQPATGARGRGAAVGCCGTVVQTDQRASPRRAWSCPDRLPVGSHNLSGALGWSSASRPWATCQPGQSWIFCYDNLRLGALMRRQGIMRPRMRKCQRQGLPIRLANRTRERCQGQNALI